MIPCRLGLERLALGVVGYQGEYVCGAKPLVRDATFVTTRDGEPEWSDFINIIILVSPSVHVIGNGVEPKGAHIGDTVHGRVYLRPNKETFLGAMLPS